ncbi:DUF1360 domain-containing protein [bacterium]|nr:DUF1360 domain-containing protein [bacterium]
MVAVLATWRLCHLIAHEDGPFGAIARLRRAAGAGELGHLMDCPYCLSLWIAAPVAALLAGGWRDGILLWLAISGGSCLVEQLSVRLTRATGADVIDLPPAPPLSPAGAADQGS